MKNIGQAPVIPGELHFRLFEQDGKEKIPIVVTDLQATGSRGADLDAVILQREDETDLSVQVWDPLLPGFNYDFTMSYEMQFEPSGIFFHEITLPREETTIAIRRERTEFRLADNFHVTYAPGSEVSKLSGFSVVNWDDADDARVIEFSRLPFPRVGVRAVNVFWIMIIIVLIGVLVMSSRGRKGPPPQRAPQQQYQQYGQRPQQRPQQQAQWQQQYQGRR